MIPANDHRTLTSNVANSTAFGISMENEIHLMSILRDTLYTDKVLAVLREYAANAWDAHCMVGKQATPIRVWIPTSTNPALTIRDFGPGLSPDEIATIFTQYGASTKRGSDAQVGMLGIGSKSGFAYADSFTVTSYHDGTKRIYVAVLDVSNRGTMNLLHEEPSTETGVEIKIVVRPADIYEFTQKARNLFRHFTPRPEINLDLPALPAAHTVLANGALNTEAGHGWVAIMGCVPYRVNLDQLPDLPKFLRNISGSVNFPIGAVDINASREELKYSTRTKAALTDKFTALVDEYVEHALRSLESGTFTQWDMRLRLTVLHALDLPIPEEWQAMAEGHVKLEHSTADFTIVNNRSAVTFISVTDSTRLLIDDTGKDLKGYYLKHEDYVVRPAVAGTDIRPLLDAALTAAGLTGITVELLSSVSWSAPYVKPKKVVNAKHRARMFKFTGKTSSSIPSNGWTVETRVALPADVFVVLTGFKAYSAFAADYRIDTAIAEVLGITMPAVYGYKSTELKPVDPTKVIGTEYRAWRADLAKQALTPEVIDAINSMYWADPFQERYSLPNAQSLTLLEKDLGTTHVITEVVRASLARPTVKLDASILVYLARIGGFSVETSAARTAAAGLCTRYPLLKSARFSQLWDRHDDDRAAWVDYVKVVDLARP